MFIIYHLSVDLQNSTKPETYINWFLIYCGIKLKRDQIQESVVQIQKNFTLKSFPLLYPLTGKVLLPNDIELKIYT